MSYNTIAPFMKRKWNRDEAKKDFEKLIRFFFYFAHWGNWVHNRRSRANYYLADEIVDTRERQRHTETERQRQTYKDRDTNRLRQIDREAETEKEREWEGILQLNVSL